MVLQEKGLEEVDVFPFPHVIGKVSWKKSFMRKVLKGRKNVKEE